MKASTGPQQSTSDLRTLRRVFRLARRFWPHITVVFLIDLLAMPLALLTPIPLQIAVDSVIGSAPIPSVIAPWFPTALVESDAALLATAAALVVLIATVNKLRALAATIFRTRVGHCLQLRFRATLFDHAQRLSLAYHDEKGTNDATYRILYDTPAIQNLTVSTIPILLGAAITFVGMTYVTVAISPRLAAVALLVSPILVGLGSWHRRGVRSQWTKVKRLEHEAYTVVQESFSELRLVKAFGQEERERDRFIRRTSDEMEALHSVQISEGLFQLLLGTTTALGTGAVLFIGVQDVVAGSLSLGGMLVVMSYLSQLYAPLESMVGQLTAVQNSLVMAERAFSLLDRRADVKDCDNPVRVDRLRGGVRFDDVSFSYRSGEQVIESVSLTVRPGARVGIAGRTGAGKTTLLNLLVRFYDPAAGRILIDDVDLRDYALNDLRHQFSLVLQDTLMFSVSIEENLLYARPGATREQIEAAARAANAHDFILGLPEGYNTLVGQRGMCLSGGERQRLSLARAFLRDSPILILDEPTSAVDLATERVIIDAMQRLMEGRTTFMVAHRLSTLESCDLLIVMDRGRVITATDDVRALLREAARLGSLEAAARQGWQADVRAASLDLLTR